MAAIALGLAASASWGIADFIGGVQARRLAVITVLAATQPVALILATTVALTAGGSLPPAGDLALAWAGGSAGALALGALWAGMARGTIGVVSPISAMGVLVPVAFGLVRGERPGAVEAAGIGLAVAGVALAARASTQWPARDGASVLFAGAAAAGFGLMFVGVDVAAEHDPAWAVCAARAGGVSVVLLGAALVHGSIHVQTSHVPRLVLVGALDVLGSGLYALATTLGLLSLVAVSASLYPAVTVLLGGTILHEGLLRIQRLGVVAIIVGVAAIAYGGAA